MENKDKTEEGGRKEEKGRCSWQILRAGRTRREERKGEERRGEGEGHDVGRGKKGGLLMCGSEGCSIFQVLWRNV